MFLFKKNNRISISVCFFFIVISFIAIFTSCSTTYLTGAWKDQSYNRGPFKKFAVIAVFNDLNQKMAVEQQVAKSLRDNGVQTIEGLSLFPPDKEFKKDNLEDKLNELNVDGILIISLKRVDTQSVSVPGSYQLVPATYYNYYYNYYFTTYKEVYTPGYVTQTKLVVLESNLYANDSDKLVWRGETESMDPKSAYSMANELGSVLVKNFKEYDLIKK